MLSKRFISLLTLAGFSLCALISVLPITLFAESSVIVDELGNVQKIIENHDLALKLHQGQLPGLMKRPSKLMEEGGVENILDEKPAQMTTTQYMGILNDYAFFLSDSYSEDEQAKLEKEIKILRRVIALDPNRTVAHLNLGDALAKKMKDLFTYSEKIETAKVIEKHYLFYKIHSKKRLDRVEQFLKNNILNDNTRDIGDYIVRYLNKGCSDQIISIASSDETKPTLCDINNDGKRELIIIRSVNRHYSDFNIKSDVGDEWIGQAGGYNEDEMVYKGLLAKGDPVDGPEEGSNIGYPDYGIVPYRDGIYILTYHSGGPYLLSAARIDQYGNNTTLCVFESYHQGKVLGKCTDKQRCDHILKTKKLHYVSAKEYKRIVSKESWVKELVIEADRYQFLSDHSDLYSGDASLNLFTFNQTLYAEDILPGPYFPHHKIWTKKNGKPEVVCSFNFPLIHKILYKESPPKVEIPTPKPATVIKGKEIRNSLGMNFVFIKPGSFMMGNPESKPEIDMSDRLHKVTLTRGFYMQTTEVTQGQWKKVMGKNPSSFNTCGDDCPVENVSWNEVKMFIKKLNQMEGKNLYRLPTEAEWEYACRAGTSTLFAFGDRLTIDFANYDAQLPLTEFGKIRKKSNGPVKVASFYPNAWGLYDMHGNVEEWCKDGFAKYPENSVTDPQGPADENEYRVTRGGSWCSVDWDSRSYSRFNRNRKEKFNDTGFRLCRNL